MLVGAQQAPFRVGAKLLNWLLIKRGARMNVELCGYRGLECGAKP